jgi:hypothetical protein
MEGISEARLLALLRSQSPGDTVKDKELLKYETCLLHGLQVHIIVKMEIIQVLHELGQQ